uniref:NTR domain-containing protein n=2 Tax=Pyxicephalus adspersus TaxID=30357 RepID=A0AAV3B771_PYXAD|nr:TPA: hypothetical protein GDO54_007777 [Pyxicephalus adspersus]
MKECPSGVADFKHFQCSAYNSKPLMGNYYKWIPFHSGQGDCELSCLAQGQNFYYNFGKVLDGTSCHAEYDGICINGQCLQVGCDFILGSNEKVDICGVCGGRNVSCRHHHNIYTTKYPASALRNRNYHYVINGNWAINYPGVFNVAGTKIQYKRSADNLESFEAIGPTDEDLHVLFTEQNSGIEYEYWLPKDYYIYHQRDRSPLQDSVDSVISPTQPSTTTAAPTTRHNALWPPTTTKGPHQPRLERDNMELNRIDESRRRDDNCGKCRKIKGYQNKMKQYCQKDFVFRGRIISKKIVGRETRYDVQVIVTYKNNFPILRREYIWVPNTCDCPNLLEKREYILMARRHVNYEHTLNRILLESHSFVRPYRPKEDKLLRDLDQECAKYGYQIKSQQNQ